MSAVDEIQAAHDNLTALKYDALAGPWEGWKQWHPLRGQLYGIEARQVAVAVTYSTADTELIETLHRTVDAQLTILKAALDSHTPSYFDYENEAYFEEKFATPLLLARSINGATS